MKRIAIEDSNRTLKQVLEEEQNGPVLVTKSGAVAYVIAPMDEEQWETYSLSTNPDFISLIESARREYHRDGGIPLEEAWRRLSSEASRST